MRFVILASFAESVVNFRLDLIKDLQKRGCEVHVVCPSIGPMTKEAIVLRKLGVTTHEVSLTRTGINPFADFVYAFMLLRVLRSIKPAGILAYTVKPVVYGIFSAAILRVPTRCALITGLGLVFSDTHKSQHRLLRLLVEFLYKLSIPLATLVIFQNKEDLALFEDAGILRSTQPVLVVGGSGVNLQHFNFREPAVNYRFLFVGRYLRSKGIHDFVEAAELLRDSYPGAEFHIAGWSDDSPDAVHPYKIKDWVKRGFVIDHGRLADVRELLAHCSVLVAPSAYREGVPRSILEAMAVGRPIITTNSIGCKDTVVHQENGFLVERGSVSGLVDSMRFFIEHPGEVRRMGALSRILQPNVLM